MKENTTKFENQEKQKKEALQELKREYQKPEMSQEQVRKLHLRMEEAKKENRQARSKRRITWMSTAAAAAILFIILPNTSPSIAYAMEQLPIIGSLVSAVTFQNYQYEDDRHKADIVVPKLEIDGVITDTRLEDKLEQTTGEINDEIHGITTQLLSEFTEYMYDEMGYQEIVVTSEVLATTPDYFTLKLICYQGAGSGYQWNYYYTIDLNTGERLRLKDIFTEGTDYITPISENIKAQMQAQMSADENVCYWLHDEIEELNFKEITEETSFYLNETDNVVICFNEGEVAPMYMGVVEFEIPKEVLSGIRK